MMKLFVRPWILNIFIPFSETNACMPGFQYVNKHKKKKKKKKEYDTQFSKQLIK